jgi:uncharacterized damage-inducible protein DinB
MKKHYLYLTFLFFALLGTAQTVDELVSEFERARKITLSYLDAMPPDKYGFRPKKEIRTFSEQILHASQGTFNLVANATGAERKYGDQNLEKDPALQSKAEVTRLVNESFDFAISAIQEMDSEKMGELVKAGPFEVTRFGWLLKAFEHITHHRGQTAIYLRLAGVEPPRYQLF